MCVCVSVSFVTIALNWWPGEKERNTDFRWQEKRTKNVEDDGEEEFHSIPNSWSNKLSAIYAVSCKLWRLWCFTWKLLQANFAILFVEYIYIWRFRSFTACRKNEIFVVFSFLEISANHLNCFKLKKMENKTRTRITIKKYSFGKFESLKIQKCTPFFDKGRARTIRKKIGWWPNYL